MGLFELRRELSREGAHKAREARKQAARVEGGGGESLCEEAWARAHDATYVARLYESAAKKDEDVALALARLGAARAGYSRGGESLRALAEEQRALVAPLVASQLHGDGFRWAAGALSLLGEPRLAEVLRALLAKTKDAGQRVALATLLAEHGEGEDLVLAATHDAEETTRATIALARRGHAPSRDKVAAALAAWLEKWRTSERFSSSDWPYPFALVEAAELGRIEACVPALVASLETPLVSRALSALAAIGAEEAREPAQRVLREVVGEETRTWPYRLAAEKCLSALGEPQPVDAARGVLDRARLQRYGFPKTEDFALLQALAYDALVSRGTAADLERAARALTAPVAALRAVGLRAWEKLGRTPPALAYVDEARAAHELKREGPRALVRLLSDPGTVFPYNAAFALAASKDAAGRKAACEWACAALEGVPNPPVSYFDESDVGPHAHRALQALDKLKKDASCKKRIAASTSAWVRESVLGEKPHAAAPELARGPWAARVSRLDQAPFVFGKQVNALALDADGARLAVVGDQLGQIVDARTGALVVALELEWRWAYDAAFSPDGALLAVAYHGGHLVLFDARTGRRERMLEGFGGVPDGVKKLAFSPDGALLAAGGSCGNAIVFRVASGAVIWKTKGEGAFEAVAFSPDGATCLFSHVKSKGGVPNYLVVLDVARKKATRVDAPSSIWAVAWDGARWLAGGAGASVVPLEGGLRPAKKGVLPQKKVVRLALAPDGAMIAAAQTGDLVRFVPGTKEVLRIASGPDGSKDALGRIAGALWALAVAPDGTIFAAGTEGVVHRFSQDGRPLAGARGEVHTGQVRGFARMKDGSTLTCGWDGKLLRWPEGFGQAALVRKEERRMAEMAVQTDGTRAFVGCEKRLLVVDAYGAMTEHAMAGEIEAIAASQERVAVGTGDKRVHVLGPDLRELFVATLDAKPSSLAIADDGAILVGTEKGGLMELDASDGVVRWSRKEHGRDLVDKDPYGSPHRDVVGLAAHGPWFASASNDDTLRVFRRDGHERRLRALVDVGLFNGCAFSPDGRVVAVSRSWGLDVFEVEGGAWLTALHVRAFPGADELTRLAFEGPRAILVGAENGSVFRVTLGEP